MKIIKVLLLPFIMLTMLVSCGNSRYTYYTVSFDTIDGSKVESQRVMENNPVVLPNNPEKEGYSFVGWYISEEYSDETKWDFHIDRVVGNMTLYARWDLINENPTLSLTYTRVTDGYEVSGVSEEERIIIPSIYNDQRVVSIGSSAFARKNITYVNIPDSVERIGLNAFSNASTLKEVVIGENSNLTTIENNAFSGNSALEKIYIPSKMISLGDNVFNNASSLDSIVVADDNPRYSSEGNNLIDKETGTLIRGTSTSIIPESVRVISQAAFRRSNIEVINIPSSVTEIGNYVFDDCANLKEINVDINNQVYSSVSHLLYTKDLNTLIKVPEGYSGILTLSSSLQVIPSYAFDGIETITEVRIPLSVESIQFGAFRNVSCTIRYEGTENEWNEIAKNSLWGGAALDIHYNQVI